MLVCFCWFCDVRFPALIVQVFILCWRPSSDQCMPYICAVSGGSLVRAIRHICVVTESLLSNYFLWPVYRCTWSRLSLTFVLPRANLGYSELSFLCFFAHVTILGPARLWLDSAKGCGTIRVVRWNDIIALEGAFVLFFSKTARISSDDLGESDVFCAHVSYKPCFSCPLSFSSELPTFRNAALVVLFSIHIC